MPEFNRNFAQGKMNKDLDERLVPAGQYRDAMNVQVSTSDGSNVGSLENILGNTEVSVNVVPEGGYCVGSIVDNEVNCIYYLVAGNEFEHIGGNTLKKNYIIKYDIDTDEFTRVFVDIYHVETNVVANQAIFSGITPAVPSVELSSIAGIRPGMTFSANQFNQDVKVENVVGNNACHNNQFLNVPNGTYTFSARSVLGFDKNTDITAINIVEDLLMYTDNTNEPKTINIKRSILGTGSDDLNLNSTGANNSGEFHTRLVSRRADGSFLNDGLEVVAEFKDIAVGTPVYSELENNTTIRKSPLTPPTLRMSSTSDNRPLRVDSPFNPTPQQTPFPVTLNNPFVQLIGPFGQANTQFPTNTVAPGFGTTITLDFAVSFQVGDFILITSDTSQDPLSFTDFDIRAQIMGVISNTTYTIQVTSINPDLQNLGSFFVVLEQENPLFEFKFPRFSYRYKYVDGQYSPFAPFSEIAFLAGSFDYYPKEGYNQGMANRVRSLRVENYAPHPDNRPKDIVEIDILYKEDKSTTVYTVKTIKPNDDPPLWPVSDPFTGYSVYDRGSLRIESELIHAVVPANQLLRPWDNVPRKALAQEVSANRLIYANYIQNYDLVNEGNRLITPEMDLSLRSSTYQQLNAQVDTPHKSIKSQRTYQLGVVYKDEFGRETPVLADKKGGSLIVPKEFCDDSSAFLASITNDPPAWAKSFKFFIKETSSEYYNLAMDRWYHAEDGNIWLSFASSDRNKVDEETFLELKKAHDSSIPVVQPARYKILAIENEAPQDIRIDRDVQGILTNSAFNTQLNAQIGDNANYPGQGGNYVIVRAAAFNAAFNLGGPNPPAVNVLTRASECSLKFQLITGASTRFYKIIDISGPQNEFGNANDGYRILIEDTFDFDVDNICGTSFANRNAGLQLVITHDEFEDKPEFDGKFFVKIFRDATIEQFIMILNDSQLVVVRAYDVRYLHTYDLHTGGSGSLINTRNNTQGIGDAIGNVRNDYVRAIAGQGHVHPYKSGYAWAGTSTGINTYNPVFTAGTPFPGTLPECSGQQQNATDGQDGGLPGLSTNTSNLSNFGGGVDGGDWGIYKGTWQNGNTQAISNALFAASIPLLILAGLPAATAALGVGAVMPLLTSDNYAFRFWNSYFTRNGACQLFIDDAWALSWAHLPDTIENGLQPQTNTDWHTAPAQIRDDGNLLQAIIGFFTGGNADLEATRWQDTFGTPGTIPHTAPGMPQAPPGITNGSRGIYGTRMDLSITGGFVGPDTQTQYTGWDGTNNWWVQALNADPTRMSFLNPFTLNNPNNANLFEFLSLLTLTGCRWRWAEDPDQVINTTTGFYRHYGIINAQKTDMAFGDEDYWHSWNRREKITISAQQTIYDSRRHANHDGSRGTILEIMGPLPDADAGFSSDNPAIWETHPKENVELDIYYEVSRAYPIKIERDNYETFILPGSARLISINGAATNALVTGIDVTRPEEPIIRLDTAVSVSTNDICRFEDGYGGEIDISVSASNFPAAQSRIRVFPRVHAPFNTIEIPWHNCFTFGNGVESDRIRDDFNQPQIANGVKASTTIAEQYKEERRAEGFIFSGIFNSLSGVNRLNQFIQAEPITKDLDPENGSIQKLFARDTDIVTLCEDKVLKVLSDKDALFESGGNAQLTATNRVLGQAIAFAGDYGISTTPESFAADKYRCYFTDTQRAAVLRLSKDGITPISDYGMKDYFTDTFNGVKNHRLIGTFDQRKDNYNLTISEKPEVKKVQGHKPGFNTLGQPVSIITSVLAEVTATDFEPTTITYNEQVKGWVSFKSFHPETGLGVNNNYYTFKNGSMWKHHVNETRNTFYGQSFVPSHVELLFNDAPSSVKNFQTIKYEGTQARVNKFGVVKIDDVEYTDQNYYNLNAKQGWFVESAFTDLQDGKVLEFLDREGKWFNHITGACTDFDNLDEKEFTVQGIGEAEITHSNPTENPPNPVKIEFRDSSTSNTGQNWD